MQFFYKNLNFQIQYYIAYKFSYFNYTGRCILCQIKKSPLFRGFILYRILMSITRMLLELHDQTGSVYFQLLRVAVKRSENCKIQTIAYSRYIALRGVPYPSPPPPRVFITINRPNGTAKNSLSRFIIIPLSSAPGAFEASIA